MIALSALNKALALDTDLGDAPRALCPSVHVPRNWIHVCTPDSDRGLSPSDSDRGLSPHPPDTGRIESPTPTPTRAHVQTLALDISRFLSDINSIAHNEMCAGMPVGCAPDVGAAARGLFLEWYWRPFLVLP